MKLATTLLLAASFTLSPAAASNDDKLIRGGGAVGASDLPEVPQENAEVVMTARNVRGGVNIYKAAAEVDFENTHWGQQQYCTKTSCDDPCGSITPFAPNGQTICELAANTHLAKPCETGYQCEACPGMDLKYICIDPSAVDTSSGDTTRTTNTNTTNTTDTPGLSQW